MSKTLIMWQVLLSRDIYLKPLGSVLNFRIQTFDFYDTHQDKVSNIFTAQNFQSKCIIALLFD